jgi:hypothetical protein
MNVDVPVVEIVSRVGLLHEGAIFAAGRQFDQLHAAPFLNNVTPLHGGTQIEG